MANLLGGLRTNRTDAARRATSAARPTPTSAAAHFNATAQTTPNSLRFTRSSTRSNNKSRWGHLAANSWFQKGRHSIARPKPLRQKPPPACLFASIREDIERAPPTQAEANFFLQFSSRKWPRRSVYI